MGVQVTITLDEDVLENIKRESESAGKSLDETVNERLRRPATQSSAKPSRELRLGTLNLGYRPELNYDCVASLIEYAEDPQHT